MAVFTDNALRNAFGSNFNGTVKRGNKGNKVVAVQYALGRLGHLHYICDGSFGRLTEAAVRSFQNTINQPENGVVDLPLLNAMDDALETVEDTPPAARRGVDPLAYLSDFAALGMPTITIDRTAESHWSWDKKEIRDAYGRFVGDYWEVMKANQVEADCKTIALFLMDQFRKQLAQDTFIELPRPRDRGSIPDNEWKAATKYKTMGFFSRVEDVSKVRGGYSAVKKVQALDPNHSMLRGVNVRYRGINANGVSRAAKTVEPWRSSRKSRNPNKPEISINKLKPGYIIFIDHRGDGKYDHTVNVIKVKKFDDGNVRQVVLAVGSYDDIKDALSSTHVRGLGELNNYAEEVVVDFDRDGLVTKSRVTYASEPDYLVKPRYHAGNTLREKRGGGKIKISRWG